MPIKKKISRRVAPRQTKGRETTSLRDIRVLITSRVKDVQSTKVIWSESSCWFNEMLAKHKKLFRKLKAELNSRLNEENRKQQQKEENQKVSLSTMQGSPAPIKRLGKYLNPNSKASDYTVQHAADEDNVNIKNEVSAHRINAWHDHRNTTTNDLHQQKKKQLLDSLEDMTNDLSRLELQTTVGIAKLNHLHGNLFSSFFSANVEKFFFYHSLPNVNEKNRGILIRMGRLL